MGRALHRNRLIGASERRQLIQNVRFQVPFLGLESRLKSGFACAGLLMLREQTGPIVSLHEHLHVQTCPVLAKLMNPVPGPAKLPAILALTKWTETGNVNAKAARNWLDWTGL